MPNDRRETGTTAIRIGSHRYLCPEVGCEETVFKTKQDAEAHWDREHALDDEPPFPYEDEVRIVGRHGLTEMLARWKNRNKSTEEETE